MSESRRVLWWAAAIQPFCALMLPGCRQSQQPQRGVLPTEASQQSTQPAEGAQPVRMMIKSEAFHTGQVIPTKHTEDGEDVSPALTWSNVPPLAKELALICDDPDAPTEEPWVHWVIYKIPATAGGLPEGLQRAERLPPPLKALQGKNSWNVVGYRGPAPPKGHGVHHYHFKLYALNAPLTLGPSQDKAALLKAMSGHILGETELVGTYQRQ